MSFTPASTHHGSASLPVDVLGAYVPLPNALWAE